MYPLVLEETSLAPQGGPPGRLPAAICPPTPAGPSLPPSCPARWPAWIPRAPPGRSENSHHLDLSTSWCASAMPTLSLPHCGRNQEQLQQCRLQRQTMGIRRDKAVLPAWLLHGRDARDCGGCARSPVFQPCAKDVLNTPVCRVYKGIKRKPRACATFGQKWHQQQGGPQQHCAHAPKEQWHI